MSDELQVGDPVTLSWYEPGEPYRPRGRVDLPTAEDRARLEALEAGDGQGGVDRLLVHWRGPATPDHRRWERRADLRVDVEQ